jgi:glycosyltransferase involved in cell wall biosynthesis
MTEKAPLSTSSELPLVSIAIPTLNRCKFLKLAIESALAQTYPCVEILVSNNASTDETEEFLALLTDPRLNVLTQSEKVPMVDNWNKCVEVAKGKYFILLSDDDLLEANAISELVKRYEDLKDGSSPGIVYSRAHVIDGDGKLIRTTESSPLIESAEDFILGFFRVKRRVMLCSILFRTSDVLPGFSKFFTLANDAALWMRLSVEYGYVAFVDEPLSRYRFADNLTYAMSTEFWFEENTKLMDMVRVEFRKKRGIDAKLERELDEALTRYNLQCFSTGLRVKYRLNKWGGYKAYFLNMKRFRSTYGVGLFFRSMIVLLLPEDLKPALRKIFR